MNAIQRLIIIIISLCNVVYCTAVSFTGLAEGAFYVEAPASTGLNGGIYVLPTVAGVTVSVPMPSSPSAAKVYRFSNLGAAYAEEITSTATAASIKFAAEPTDMGYVVEAAGVNTYFWVVDYSAHALQLDALTLADADCGSTTLHLAGNAAEIPYYSISGRRMTLSRGLQATYTTLVFDQETFSYRQQEVTQTFDYAGASIAITSPLCATAVTLTGDIFLTAWHRPQSISTGTIDPVAVDAQTRATQAERNNDNEQKDNDNDSLGGSAPCEISFEAAVTDAAIFTEWQLSRDAAFNSIDNSYTDTAFSYTFRDNGTTYVRFVANNAEGTCEYVGTAYNINIGESRLVIPNAFSPDASPGVNDEWKVSYKSLVSFECSIFNRWGKLLFHTTDPAQGWDGRHGGKYVPAGVYFYVIKAEGADGVEYKKSGDINIIKQRSSTTGTTNTDE